MAQAAPVNKTSMAHAAPANKTEASVVQKEKAHEAKKVQEKKTDANPPVHLGAHAHDNTGARALDSGFKAIVKTIVNPKAAIKTEDPKQKPQGLVEQESEEHHHHHHHHHHHKEG